MDDAHTGDDRTGDDGATRVLVEAEAFADHGGWVMDSQFEVEMGSPYLLAHGLGRPVADATTAVDIPAPGRTASGCGPRTGCPPTTRAASRSRSTASSSSGEFGANGQDWSWEYGGVGRLGRGPVRLSLHDLTGFDGRCDAIYLTRGRDGAADGADAAARPGVKQLLRACRPSPREAGDVRRRRGRRWCRRLRRHALPRPASAAGSR